MTSTLQDFHLACDAARLREQLIPVKTELKPKSTHPISYTCNTARLSCNRPAIGASETVTRHHLQQAHAHAANSQRGL